ncbi:MAG: hypothetical protein GY797_17705 [Deltaproteobacteria bacterium]|nr:hypothetical protein [Deltaproteobacteria bacterium]
MAGEWWHDTDHEVWKLFDFMNTDWLEVDDYIIWQQYHMSARFVIFFEKKMAKEMKEYEEWVDYHSDPMGNYYGRNY